MPPRARDPARAAVAAHLACQVCLIQCPWRAGEDDEVPRGRAQARGAARDDGSAGGRARHLRAAWPVFKHGLMVNDLIVAPTSLRILWNCHVLCVFCWVDHVSDDVNI